MKLPISTIVSSLITQINSFHLTSFLVKKHGPMSNPFLILFCLYISLKHDQISSIINTRLKAHMEKTYILCAS
jgi:hypothetical protein